MFGLETDLQWTGQRGSTSFCLTVACPLGSFVANADYKLQWFGTARARAGWLVDPRVLLYVTGGAAYGQVKADYAAGILGLPLLASSVSTTRLGWTVGGGIEGMLSPNWTVKAEYLYVDLGTTASGALGGATTTILANVPGQGFTTVIDTTFAGAARDARARQHRPHRHQLSLPPRSGCRTLLIVARMSAKAPGRIPGLFCLALSPLPKPWPWR